MIQIIGFIVICAVILLVRAVIQNVAYRKQLEQYRQQMKADGIKSLDVSYIGEDGKLVKKFITRDVIDGGLNG